LNGSIGEGEAVCLRAPCPISFELDGGGGRGGYGGYDSDSMCTGG